MLIVIVKRLLAGLLVLLALIAAVFILRQLTPVDPARAIVGFKAPAAAVTAERVKLGLNDPLWVQYVHYVEQVAAGHFGESAVSRQPILTNLATYLPATLELVVVAFVIALLLGSFFGVATAQGWRGAPALRVIMIVASSLPVFLTALLGIIFFNEHLGWLPATGESSLVSGPTGPTGFVPLDALLAGRLNVFTDALAHLMLPATCLALAPVVSIGRVLRSSLQQSLRSDYVRTARSKGLREVRVFLSHGLRNSVGPTLAMSGVQIAALFGSILVVEDIFSWPGIGLYTVQAIDKGDFGTVAAVTLTLGAIYVVANLVVDLLQAVADPRIRALSNP